MTREQNKKKIAQNKGKKDEELSTVTVIAMRTSIQDTSLRRRLSPREHPRTQPNPRSQSLEFR